METLDEKKTKKKNSFVTYTTGNPAYADKKFNKYIGNDNNNPSTEEAQKAAEKACSEVGTFLASSADGGNCIATGGEVSGEASSAASTAGDAGGCCESLDLEEDKIFSPKAEMYFEGPNNVHLLSVEEVTNFISALSPKEEFKVGYITPIYFYKKLLDKFALIKCTEFVGYTGMDYRDVRGLKALGHEADSHETVAASQIANPKGKTDYGIDYNKENNKVKSYVKGMRKEYGEVNKTVKQADRDIYGDIDPETGEHKVIGKMTDLKTILFYPKEGSTPKTKYYIDLHDGKGCNEIPEAMLQPVIYKKVIELTNEASDHGIISDEEDMTDVEITFLKNVQNKVKHVIESERSTSSTSVMSKTAVRALYTNQIYYLNTTNKTVGKSLMESLESNENILTEAKRYVRRYYMRPQNVFCSNKTEVLQALIKYEDQNCSIYTLNNLGDIKDVTKLTNDDIIYYYDDGILYDKNHVRIMDYDLAIKHEEDREHINVDQVSDAKFADVYEDRLTDMPIQESLTEEINPFALDFESINAFGESLHEAKEEHICCICGEPFEGYGNNPEPYISGENGEKCCDACNLKFVIPQQEWIK